jgi:chaperone modulatory protein CbpM
MSVFEVERFSYQEVALRAGVDPEFVAELVRVGAIEPDPNDRAHFATEVTIRVSKVRRLQNDLGVNVEGAAVIILLLDRIAELEHQLKALGRR